MTIGAFHRREALVGLVSVLAIGIVFAAVGGRVPARWLPAVPVVVLHAIPHVNVAISVAAIIAIGIGWAAIRRGNLPAHRRAMVLAVVLFLAFLSLYLYRLIVLGGPTTFDGPQSTYRFVYLPLLTVHVIGAVACIPLLVDAISLALTTPTAQLPTTRHPTVGRAAATLWILSYVLGIGVYVLLHWS